VSLNALTRYDHDIGVIGEQCQSSVEVLRREAAAELVDRCENAFDIGHTSHRLDNRSNKEHREAGERWRHDGAQGEVADRLRLQRSGVAALCGPWSPRGGADPDGWAATT